MLSGKGAVAHEGCDHTEESGYEVWRSLPPQDAKVKFAGVVDCDTETYTLTYSFVPDMVRDFIIMIFAGAMPIHVKCCYPHR
jgi:hypothetical protein